MQDDALTTAVRKLLDDPHSDPGLEVHGAEEAGRAVRLLDEGLRVGPGVYRRIAEGAQRGAETLSTDRLQVLSEFVQNADDAGASQLRFVWRPDGLLIAHDGGGVRLGDVLLLGMPWLSGKTSDAEATGRFGIGLATLRMLATTWEVHCHPFHVKFTDLALEPAKPLRLHEGIAGDDWTVFRIPLKPGSLASSDLFDWFETWSDSSLLFLRHLKRLEVTCDVPIGEEEEAGQSRVLELSWQDVAEVRLHVGGMPAPVRVRDARTSDGSLWRVYDTQVPPHSGWGRHHKALGATMPVGVALPFHPDAAGSIHAGLPVAPFDVPVRVNAQFDPVVSREGFAASRLNHELVTVVADLWTAAVLDVFGEVDPSAWHLVPLPLPAEGAAAGFLLQDAVRAAFLARSRNELAAGLLLPCPDGSRAHLSDFAVEEPVLSEVLDETDIARLADVPYTFPAAARDGSGRWREVLVDWRAEGRADVRDEVETIDALELLGEEGYDIGRTIRLTAVAVEMGHEYLLARRPCVVTADGRRLWPSNERHVFAEGEVSGLLDGLGVVRDLHPGYWHDTRWSKRVVDWLRRKGRLVRRDDTASVLRCVARLGESGGSLSTEKETGGIKQLVALQRALGDVPKRLQDQLGPGIGRAVLLDCYEYDADGNELPCRAKPGAAYLSHTLESTDGDRFAVAARRTPGLVWVHRSYARSLLSASQSNGLSRTAFLRLLGVADTPRLRPLLRGSAVKEYVADHRIGLCAYNTLSPVARGRDISRQGADHTLDDRISRDLDAVVENIIAEHDADERRRRTAALLQTVSKPGMVTTPDHARVHVAKADRRWVVKGETAALWVWRLRDAAWLEDSSGNLRAPADICLRTRDAEALYGQEDPGYLHPAIQAATSTRGDVLMALGVSGDPDVPDLMARLKTIKTRATDGGPVTDEVKAEVYLVYRALAGRLADRSADTSRSAVEREIRLDLADSRDLILTDQGWRRAGDCFRGPTILRGFRPFVVPGDELVPLWRALGIDEPGAEDLVDVLKEIAKQGTPPVGEQQRVMLEALRALCDKVTAMDGPVPLALRNKLRWLPLWTSDGWTKAKPVYAVDHPLIARNLGADLPMWQPGGDVAQFAGLLSLLRIKPLEAAEAQVIAPDRAIPDARLTQDFRQAVTELQDCLVRNEPDAATAFTDWGWLAELDVRILPGMRIRLHPVGDETVLDVPVDAQIDRATKALFVSTSEALRTKRGAGLAIASQFSAERTHVSHRWQDLWEEDRTPGDAGARLTSAGQHDHDERERLANQLRERTTTPAATPTSPSTPATSRRASSRPFAPSVPSPRSEPKAPPAVGASTSVPGPRRLIDAAELAGRTPKATHISSPPAGSPSLPAQSSRRRGRPTTSLPQPRPGGAVPRGQSERPGYRDSDKEEVVIGLLGQVLQEQGATIVDQRGIHGLGADAVDSTGRFYEIKAHGGELPPEITFTRAEFKRALTEGENYALVLASHLEEGTGTPSLRIVTDPLRFFEVEPAADIKIKGVRDPDAEATVWEWLTEDS